jgi:hypothetical protein
LQVSRVDSQSEGCWPEPQQSKAPLRLFYTFWDRGLQQSHRYRYFTPSANCLPYTDRLPEPTCTLHNQADCHLRQDLSNRLSQIWSAQNENELT